MSKAPAKKKKPAADCNCLVLANAEMKKQFGAVFTTCLQMDFANGKASVAGPFLQLQWSGDKPKGAKRLPEMVCTYCPFCGKKKQE